MVWSIIEPQCTRLIVTTDGFETDPEMLYFFNLLDSDETAKRLQSPSIGPLRDSRCIREPLHSEVRDSVWFTFTLRLRNIAHCWCSHVLPVSVQALAQCPMLFFNRTSMSSLASLGLLAYADVRCVWALAIFFKIRIVVLFTIHELTVKHQHQLAGYCGQRFSIFAFSINAWQWCPFKFKLWFV